MIAPVTVIVPCHNEEAGLPQLFTRLRDMHAKPDMAEWRFLFVDDGSTDDTLGLLLREERQSPWIEVVRNPGNLGLGAALRTGVACTASPVVCSMDSDCTYPPERLPELTALIDRGFDLATASAWHPENTVIEGNQLRLFLSRTVSQTYKWLVGQDVYTFTCLFRACRRELFERIRIYSDGFASVAEMMLGAMRAGYKIAEVPMPIEPRRYGESKLKVSDAVMTHAMLLSLTALITTFTSKRFSMKGRRKIK